MHADCTSMVFKGAAGQREGCRTGGVPEVLSRHSARYQMEVLGPHGEGLAKRVDGLQGLRIAEKCCARASQPRLAPAPVCWMVLRAAASLFPVSGAKINLGIPLQGLCRAVLTLQAQPCCGSKGCAEGRSRGGLGAPSCPAGCAGLASASSPSSSSTACSSSGPGSFTARCQAAALAAELPFMPAEVGVAAAPSSARAASAAPAWGSGTGSGSDSGSDVGAHCACCACAAGCGRGGGGGGGVSGWGRDGSLLAWRRAGWKLCSGWPAAARGVVGAEAPRLADLGGAA